MTKQTGAFALLGICLAVAVSAFADGVGYVTFQNQTNGQIRVDILHSDGKFQKGGYVGANAQKQFKFSTSDTNCKAKARKYEVYRAPAGVKQGNPVVAGDFNFKATRIPTANQNAKCALTLQLMETNLQDLGYASGWDSEELGERSTTVPIIKSSN